MSISLKTLCRGEFSLPKTFWFFGVYWKTFKRGVFYGTNSNVQVLQYNVADN